MPNALDIMVGQKLHKVARVHDYIQLWFDSGAVLNIFNSFTLVGCTDQDVTQLVGAEVMRIEASEAYVGIFFMNEKSIRVAITDDDYRGPEAMEYISDDNKRIIWS